MNMTHGDILNTERFGRPDGDINDYYVKCEGYKGICENKFDPDDPKYFCDICNNKRCIDCIKIMRCPLRNSEELVVCEICADRIERIQDGLKALDREKMVITGIDNCLQYIHEGRFAVLKSCLENMRSFL